MYTNMDGAGCWDMSSRGSALGRSSAPCHECYSDRVMPGLVDTRSQAIQLKYVPVPDHGRHLLLNHIDRSAASSSEVRRASAIAITQAELSLPSGPIASTQCSPPSTSSKSWWARDWGDSPLPGRSRERFAIK